MSDRAPNGFIWLWLMCVAYTIWFLWAIALDAWRNRGKSQSCDDLMDEDLMDDGIGHQKPTTPSPEAADDGADKAAVACSAAPARDKAAECGQEANAVAPSGMPR